MSDFGSASGSSSSSSSSSASSHRSSHHSSHHSSRSSSDAGHVQQPAQYHEYPPQHTSHGSTVMPMMMPGSGGHGHSDPYHNQQTTTQQTYYQPARHTGSSRSSLNRTFSATSHVSEGAPYTASKKLPISAVWSGMTALNSKLHYKQKGTARVQRRHHKARAMSMTEIFTPDPTEELMAVPAKKKLLKLRKGPGGNEIVRR